MKIAIVSLTASAYTLSETIKSKLEEDVDIYINKRVMDVIELTDHTKIIEGDFKSFCGTLFKKYSGIIFIMASGIVVRSISPYLDSKDKDPAVLVVDEKGKFVISLLSGHLGGANELAIKIANLMNAQPVITTATDINDKISFDLIAKKNNLYIENISDLKYISGEILKGRSVGVISDLPINGVSDDLVLDIKKMPSVGVVITNSTLNDNNFTHSLILRPKNLILGVGCRRGVKFEVIYKGFLDFMNECEKSVFSIKAIGSIDIKKDENGLIEFCNHLKLKPIFFSSDNIKDAKGSFSSSKFVESVVGVGSVCEPCAVLAGKNAKLIVSKRAFNGVTFALAEEEGQAVCL